RHITAGLLKVWGGACHSPADRGKSASRASPHGIPAQRGGEDVDAPNPPRAEGAAAPVILRLAAGLRRRMRYQAAGMTNMLSRGAVTMPPTMGAAMRAMTSAPVLCPHIMGMRPAITTATVIALGRTRNTAPSRIAASNVASLSGSPAARRCAKAFLR